MKYLVFENKEEAVEVEAAISLSMGYAKPGINLQSGELDPDVITERWDIPRQISGGRWVITSPDENGVESAENWWPQEEHL